jgi:uncharacterized protein (UPF0371 family)
MNLQKTWKMNRLEITDGKRYLDRGTKLLLLNILKKGYIDDNDISLLSKKIVFNINIKDWIPIVFNQE